MHAVWKAPLPPHAGNSGWPAGPADYSNMFSMPLDGQVDGIEGPSNPQQRPMRSRPPPSPLPAQTLYSDDPAFSNDPSEHPDFFQAPLKEDIRITIPNRTPVEDGQPVQPPSYDDAVPGPSPIAPKSAESQYSTDSGPPFVSDFLRPPVREDDAQSEQEELLAYLQEDWNDVAQEVNQVHNNADIPQALRPGRTAPVQHSDLPTPTLPQDHYQERGRSVAPPVIPHAVPNAIPRSATAPPIPTQTDGPGGFPGGMGRPQIQRRNNTGSPMRASDLDRIDELDESVPMGAQTHLRGPYEVGRVNEPPPRFSPGDRFQANQVSFLDLPFELSKKVYASIQSSFRQHILHAQDPPDVPPAPVPFKLNLKPGEVLTRVPSTVVRKPVPQSNRNNVPALLRSQTPATQAASRTLRNGANELANPSFHLQNQQHLDWTPEQLYNNYAPIRTQPRQRPDFPGPYPAGDSVYGSNPSSVHSSRTDLPLRGYNENPAMNGFPNQRRVDFAQDNQIIPPVQHSLSRSASTPLMSKPGSFSSSSSSLSRGPPPPSDRYRPKRIVMPAPLQQQNPNQPYQTYTTPSAIVPPVKPAAPTAAVIPMHDAKKGNMLKKRASTNTAPQYVAPPPPPPQAVPVRKPSASKGFFGFGSGSNRNSAFLDEVEGASKAKRKLSKRRA